MVKQIIDEHFKVNYNYYKNICNKYFNNRYIAEDMLHQLYLSFLDVKEDVVIKFNEIGKLKNIGGNILVSLYTKRNQGNKNKGASSSPLHEIPILHNTEKTIRSGVKIYCSKPEKESISFYKAGFYSKQSDLDNSRYLIKEKQLSKMEVAINEKLTGDTWFATKVFLLCQEQSILSLSKQTKISRSYLTKAYAKGQEILKAEINKTA